VKINCLIFLQIFTALFTVEMVLKMFAFAPYKYFKETWNIFDFVVVTLSLLEIILSDKLPDGLSVLRVFRLIRLVSAFVSCPTGSVLAPINIGFDKMALSATFDFRPNAIVFNT